MERGVNTSHRDGGGQINMLQTSLCNRHLPGDKAIMKQNDWGEEKHLKLSNNTLPALAPYG